MYIQIYPYTCNMSLSTYPSSIENGCAVGVSHRCIAPRAYGGNRSKSYLTLRRLCPAPCRPMSARRNLVLSQITRNFKVSTQFIFPHASYSLASLPKLVLTLAVLYRVRPQGSAAMIFNWPFFNNQSSRANLKRTEPHLALMAWFSDSGIKTE